jgi:Protein of unknown function (DUF4031)
MSVYVDNYFAQFGRMKMSHMIADSLEELHAMADQIGVARRWFQEQSSFPHYDVCKAKRELAIGLGAIALEKRDFVMKMRELRGHFCRHVVTKG